MKALIIGLILLTSSLANAQIIDYYGIKVGTGLSNQYWDFKDSGFSNLSGWQSNKIGFSGQVYGEKALSKYFSFRPVLGYIQKGYRDKLLSRDQAGGEVIVTNRGVALHNLSLDLSAKINPMQKGLKPYIILGLRGDYLMDYRGVTVEINGVEQETNTPDEFDKFTLGGLIGVGISYNDLFFLDLEYNPAISRNFESGFLAIHGRYFNLAIGMSINKLIQQN